MTLQELFLTVTLQFLECTFADYLLRKILVLLNLNRPILYIISWKIKLRKQFDANICLHFVKREHSANLCSMEYHLLCPCI